MTPAKRFAEMKDSGIEWVGMIPAHWHIKVLFQLVSQVKNKNKDLSETNLLSLSYGKIKRKNIDDTEGLLPASFDSYNIIENNDIVLRLTDLQNDHTSLRVGRATERGIITSAYITIRPTNSRMSEYLYYLLHSFDIKKGFYGMGSGVRQGLNYDEVKMLKLPLPPLNEESAIAAYLDTQCAKIDEIIAQAKASIEDYKQWKASIICEAVTKGLDPNVEMKDSGVEWIGKVPKEWKAIPLKVCTSKIGSGKTPQGGAETYQDNGVLFLRSQNVYNTGLELDGVYYISDEIDSTMKNSRVRYNDVLLNITGGSIGRCCLFDLPDTAANVNQHVCIIRTKPEILLPQFLRYFWNSAAGPMVIDQYQTGSNRQGLNFEQIGATHIPLCSIAEQRQIVAMLDQKCAVIDQLMAEKQSLIDDLESYKKSLIYEVVTGKRYIR